MTMCLKNDGLLKTLKDERQFSVVFTTENEVSVFCDTIPVCPICGEKFKVIVGKHQTEERHKVVVKGHNGCQSVSDNMPRYKSITFDKLKGTPANKEIMDYIRNWDKNPIGGFITSNCGTGKTSMMICLYKKILNESETGCSFFTLYDLITRIKNQMFEGTDKTLKYVKEVDVLFLDDVGVEKPTEYVIETFYSIINTRYNNELPTFISTNLSLKDFKSMFGDRFLSRFYECCKFFKIEDKDYRRENNV